MVVAGRPPHSVDQTGFQGTEGLLVEHKSIVNLDNEAATGQSPHSLGESFSSFAKQFRVEQAIHAPVQDFLLTGGRNRSKRDCKSKPTKNRRDMGKLDHHRLKRPVRRRSRSPVDCFVLHVGHSGGRPAKRIGDAMDAKGAVPE